MVTDSQIKHVVIVGGGTAGWMSAAALSSVLFDQSVKITLVESTDIPPVGVGEATIPQMQNFNDLIGIDENEFVKNTQGTFKLGIEFVDWGQIGESYIHSFGGLGKDLDSVKFYHHWWRLYSSGKADEIGRYATNIVAAYQGKFMRPIKAGDSPLSEIAYAFHFDSILYGRFLREHCLKKNVSRIEAKVSDVKLSKEDGRIEKLRLDNGREISGDFFIDCTGFRSLLLDKALGMDYIDWSHWLPCDSAWAVPCERTSEPIPYTKAIALEAGWRWRIPLQHRTGNGYVFSSQYIEPDRALDALLAGLDGKPLSEPKKINFITGKRKDFWFKNCLGVGLSSGFMEPLESTSIHLIQSALVRFLKFFPDKNINQPLIDEYNRLAHFEFDKIRDFLILHYYVTARDDSDFWNYCRNMSIPDGLQVKLDLFKSHGRVFRDANEMFNDLSWIEVLFGQGEKPRSFHPLSTHIPLHVAEKRASHIRQVIQNSVEKMPSHQQFIDKFCRAEDVYKKLA